MSGHLLAGHAVREKMTYEFRIRGHLGKMVLSGFPGMGSETSGQDTLLRGFVLDQAALHGVLARIESLGLELVELRRIDPDGLAR